MRRGSLCRWTPSSVRRGAGGKDPRTGHFPPGASREERVGQQRSIGIPISEQPSAIHRVSPVWFRYTDIVVERGEGAYIYARDRTAYMDFTCGIGVTNTGHCHPLVIRAVQEQAATGARLALF